MRQSLALLAGAVRASVAALPALLLGACNGTQNAFGGEGSGSASFTWLFMMFLAVTGLAYALTVSFLIAALIRRRSDRTHAVEAGTHGQENPLLRPALVGWASFILAGLTGLVIASFLTDRSDAEDGLGSPLAITVNGRQWWWDVEYHGPAGATLRTANELHLPVGVPVRIRLVSGDVIHSFWVPNLAGKQDLIPGRVNDISFVPRKTGIFRGQCAEFCGIQHTNMRLLVEVESVEDFRRWWAAQLRPAQPPRSPLALAGYRTMTAGKCGRCHAISGTSAAGDKGPDLTHVASRSTIAAGALPMNERNLAGWIDDPQAHKPGAKMPPAGLDPQHLHALVAYLESLK